MGGTGRAGEAGEECLLGSEVPAETLALLKRRMELVSESGPGYRIETFPRRQWTTFGARLSGIIAVSPKAQESGPPTCKTQQRKCHFDLQPGPVR